MAFININGVNMPSPASYKFIDSDLDSADTQRNELGMLQRDRVRQGVFKAELAFKGLTNEQMLIIENAIKPVSLTVTLPTPSGIQTKTMYAGDRQRDLVKYRDINDMRWDLSFNLIEY